MNRSCSQNILQKKKRSEHLPKFKQKTNLVQKMTLIHTDMAELCITKGMIDRSILKNQSAANQAHARSQAD